MIQYEPEEHDYLNDHPLPNEAQVQAYREWLIRWEDEGRPRCVVEVYPTDEQSEEFELDRR